MSRFVNFSMIFVMSFGTVSLPFESALACGHGGGGGRSYGRTTSYYSAPRVVQPQIVYVPVQSAAPQQTVISQPVSGQYQSEPWQTNMVGNPNGSVAQPNVGQPNINQQTVVQQNAGQQIVGQQNIGQPNPGQQNVGPQNLGQQNPGQQNIPQNQGQQIPNNGAVNGQPVNGNPVNNNPINVNPNAVAPNNSAPANVNPANDANPTNDAQQQALRALFGVEESQPAQSASQQSQPNAAASFVGEWNATISADVTVRLSLNANGSFNWVALKKGQQTAFSGNFAVQNGTLSLTRSNDNQKLNGSITATQNGFNFRLENSKDNGLNFVRG